MEKNEIIRENNRLVPSAAGEEFIEIEDGLVRLLIGGEKMGNVPVVLIHGGGTDNAGISWYKLFGPLSKNYYVVAIDLPGFGATTGIEAVGGPDKMADFVAHTMQTLEISSAHLCGVSMGGDVALNIALRHPSFVRSLILIAPGGLMPLIKNKWTHGLAWVGTQMPDWLLFPMAKVANKFVKSVLKKIVNNPETLPLEVIDEFYREAQRPLAGIGYARYNQATVGFGKMKNNLLEKVHQINIPVLIFHGNDDPMVDKSGSITAAERIPNARLLLIDHCGHWLQLEVADLFLKETLAFLKEVDHGQSPS